MPHMQLGDVQIHYDVVGDGPPLVMTTGLGTGPQSRQEMIAQLAREYSVVTYHQRGTGKSSPGPARPGDRGAGRRHRRFDGPPQVPGVSRLIGLSTGTGKATVVAARHPGRVEAGAGGALDAWRRSARSDPARSDGSSRRHACRVVRPVQCGAVVSAALSARACVTVRRRGIPTPPG